MSQDVTETKLIQVHKRDNPGKSWTSEKNSILWKNQYITESNLIPQPEPNKKSKHMHTYTGSAAYDRSQMKCSNRMQITSKYIFGKRENLEFNNFIMNLFKWNFLILLLLLNIIKFKGGCCNITWKLRCEKSYTHTHTHIYLIK